MENKDTLEKGEFYAFYSLEQAKQIGECVYLDREGKEVVITEVSREHNSNWPDAEYRGVVVKFVKRTSNGSLSSYKEHFGYGYLSEW